MSWRHESVLANGLKIHYVTQGQGPLLLLLHGFPQGWYAWRHQIPALAMHYRVVAPDLRGYGDSERPVSVASYSLDRLTGDVAGLIKALGEQKAVVAGHDWGGAVAWGTALQHPEVVEKLIILNCPHPALFFRALRSNTKQMRRSWYMALFQVRGVAEWFVKKNLEGVFRGGAIRKEAFSDADIAQYKKNFDQPGAMTAALNYYRAAFKNRADAAKLAAAPKIPHETLVIWGEEDQALGKELNVGLEALLALPPKIQYVPNCSHWVMEEQPDVVNAAILAFLKGD